MGWPKCNTTLEDTPLSEVSLFEDHDFTFHQLGLFVSAICAGIAIVISFGLMFMHCIRYSRPTEQRHIIRILFMVPIYAAVSFLSFYYYHHSVYFEVLRDCYEAFAIASFFSLLCAYTAEDLKSQKEYFRSVTPKAWIFPVPQLQCIAGGRNGWLRTPRSGLTWFNVIWVSVFQYCFFRVVMTIVAVVTQHWDLYCLESLNPAFSHIWVICIEAISVTIAMYCLIQFYHQIGEDIRHHKPLLKLVAIKLVIFLSFWQTILISLLTGSGALEPSPRIQAADLKIGIPNMLLCIEMALFAIFHIFSFNYRPYVIGSKAYQAAWGDSKTGDRYQGGFLGFKAMINCFNPWDMIKAIGRSARWLVKGRRTRHQDRSYAHVNEQAQKLNDLEASTAYNGAGDDPKVQKTGEEGQTLLSAAQSNPTYAPPSPRLAGHSSNTSPWTEVEAKEYFQEQQERGNRRDDFVRGQHQATGSTGDIGLAHSARGTDRYYSPPQPPSRSQSQTRPGSSHQNFSRPTTAVYDMPPTVLEERAHQQIPPQQPPSGPRPFVTLQDIQSSRQETGVTPYPARSERQDYGYRERNDRVNMPQFPGSSE